MYGLMFFTRLSIICFYLITWLTGFVLPMDQMDMVLTIFIILNYCWCLANIVMALLPANYTRLLLFKSLIIDLAAPWIVASSLIKYFHSPAADSNSIFGLKSFWLIFGLALLWQKMLVLNADA